jgi:hypothetical protein
MNAVMLSVVGSFKLKLALMNRDLEFKYRDIHCKGITCTRPFYMGLTLAEGKKLECFEWAANNIFMSAVKI